MDDDADVPVLCQICKVSLAKLSLAEKQAHYEQHFEDTADQPRAGPSNVIDLSGDRDTKFTSSPKRLGRAKVQHPEKENIFWHRSQDMQPPRNFTPGIIPVLKQALLKSHARGHTVRAALCYEGMVHVGTEPWDMGWGCGYRNFLMACTALIDQQVQPLYFPALDQPTPPGVRNLQKWIEDAWNAGFDEEGAADLKHKLVGTKKWIGTAELYVAFLSRGIPSKLVDFPRVASSADAVLQWVQHYFTSPKEYSTKLMRAEVKTTVDEALRGASPVVVTDRMPLVLQHEGHSRTIIGFERLKNGAINLLCFDPSRRPSPEVRESAVAWFSSLRTRPFFPVSTPRKNHHSISPSKTINHVFHPRHHKDTRPAGSSLAFGSSKKRRSEEYVNMRDMKRVRGGLKAQGDLNDAIIIQDDDDDDDEDSVQAISPNSRLDAKGFRDELVEIDYNKALEFFRLKPNKVGRNDRYQILHFPLEDMLSEGERWARRVVISDVVQ